MKLGFYVKLRDTAHIPLPKYNRPEESINVPQPAYIDSLYSKFWIKYREFSKHICNLSYI